MAHEAKNFDHLLGNLKGISDDQLTAHFGLYKGYVAKLNEVESKLAEADRSATNYSFGEYSELRRRHAVPFNGTYLHQMYFENLTGDETDPSAEVKSAIESNFGSWANWEADAKACAASTPGWVLLARNDLDGTLNHWIMYEHHIGLPVHQRPILALDCWEHAFMIDYGTNKAEYLKAFVDNIDWRAVHERLAKLV